MSAENAALIAEARAHSGLDWDKSLITRLADALEQTETLLAQVRRSADEWWSLYDGELKKSAAAASDQMRRDADLLYAWAAEDAERIPVNGSYYGAKSNALRAAADRLRSGQPAGGQ